VPFTFSCLLVNDPFLNISEIKFLLRPTTSFRQQFPWPETMPSSRIQAFNMEITEDEFLENLAKKDPDGNSRKVLMSAIVDLEESKNLEVCQRYPRSRLMLMS
jgi:hypothetical protein